MKKIYILILLLRSACTSKSDDTSILDKSSCKLPCWNNITVGQTSRDEVTEYIKNSDDIDQESLQITDHSSDIFDQKIFFSSRQGWMTNQSSDIRFEIYLVGNIVGELVICGELNTSIIDIVSEIGEPENITSGDNLVGNRTVILIHPQQGISYSYDTSKLPEETEYEITPEVEVDCLNFFDPTLYVELMDMGVFSGGHYNAEETLRVMYPWDGYGNVDEKYPPRQP